MKDLQENTKEVETLQEPFLQVEKPICITQAVNALNEIILSDAVCTDEKDIIKLIRFKQWLLDRE